MELEAELRACPFCGGSASMVRGGPGNFFVQCEECRSAGDDGSEERALAAWNRRADDAELATLRSDNERLGRERDSEHQLRIRLEIQRDEANVYGDEEAKRANVAEAERDTLLAQVEMMRKALGACRPILQALIDTENNVDTWGINQCLAAVDAVLTKEPS